MGDVDRIGIRQRGVVEQNIAARDASHVRQNAHYRLRYDRFAGTGFAYQRNGFSLGYAERDTVAGFNQPLWCEEMDPEVFYTQDVGHGVSPTAS